MPKYYADGLGQLERSIREDEAVKQSTSTFAGLTDLARGIKKVGKEIKEQRKEVGAERKDFFNTYATLRQQGLTPENAITEARAMTGYTGKDFVSPGFEEAIKSKMKLAEETAAFKREKERAGLEKTKAETAKLSMEAMGDQGLGLNPKQVTEANKLAKELFGSSALRTEHGFKNIVKPIQRRMAAGETIDDIADDLRFKGQSPEFTGAVRDAAQMVTSNLSDTKTQTILDKIDDTLGRGNMGRTRDFLKQLAVKNATADEAKAIKGKERTIEFLNEVEDDLQAYEDAGGNTNIFTGTMEEIARKVGTVRNPELRKIATKILTARQKYRRSMTGVAFSPGENEEYDMIFPNINKTAEFNTATIQGLKEAFGGDVDFFYSFAMGDDAYNKLFKEDIEEEPMPEERTSRTTAPQTRERVMINPRTGQRITVQVDENNRPIPGTEQEI